MAAFMNKQFFHIEALIMNGHFHQAIRTLIPELQNDPENPSWYLQALVAASEGCRPDLVNWLAGRRHNFRNSMHIVLISRALTPGVRVEKSIKLLSNAIDLFPENAHFYYLRAKLLRDMERWQLAVSDLCNVLSLNPGYMIAYLPRASCYFELKLYLMAIEDYSEILNSTTCNHSDVYNLMYQCYQEYKKRGKRLIKFYSNFMQSEDPLLNNFQKKRQEP